VQKLAKDLYVESGFVGVTVGALLTSDGIICIDTPTHPVDARRWRQKLAQLSSRPVLFIINLDHHRDRVLGNQWFEAPVIAHESTYERVRLLPELFKNGQAEVGTDAELATDLAGVRIVAPQLTFADKLTLCPGGREVHLSYHPGSAPGAIWVEFPQEEVVFTGDTVVHAVPPLLQDSNIDQWLESLALLRRVRFPAKTIIPGRGTPLDKQGLRPMEEFLRMARRKAESLVRTKKTRAEAAAAAEGLLDNFTVPPALREHYTRRLRAGMEYLYDTLTASEAA
jgi:glyoxylase-like metal-dependent hydrolase (beta-lactamase superfamily II)